MGVYESNMKIREANKDMGLLWEKTKALWKDARAEKFEREFIERLTVEVNRSRNALDNIGLMLNRIRAELKEKG